MHANQHGIVGYDQFGRPIYQSQVPPMTPAKAGFGGGWEAGGTPVNNNPYGGAQPTQQSHQTTSTPAQQSEPEIIYVDKEFSITPGTARTPGRIENIDLTGKSLLDVKSELSLRLLRNPTDVLAYSAIAKVTDTRIIDMQTNISAIVSVVKADVFTTNRKPILVSTLTDKVLTDIVNNSTPVTIDSFKGDYYDLIDMILGGKLVLSDGSVVQPIVIAELKESLLSYLNDMEQVRNSIKDSEEDFIVENISKNLSVLALNTTTKSALLEELLQVSKHTYTYDDNTTISSLFKNETFVFNYVNPMEAWMIKPDTQEVIPVVC